ncbi:MAG: hypothetical protein CMJ48_00905 [Planctomycetaceae bacterium]|nr:hypothetical protein [Planctomycetaceae bacterium]
MYKTAALLMPVLLWTLAGPLRADDAPPLHERIDALIERQAGGPVNKPADDAEFLRRITLDLAGRIPTADETRTFLSDPDPAKRRQRIERLLADDEYPVRMQQLFDVMLMERRGDDDEWTEFLQSSFASNKSWDRMVREMVDPDADDEATRGSAFFISKRLEKYGQNPTDYPGLVRDVGRMFLGVDVECAQCHDHLFVDDYHQEDYQGLFAFLGTVTLRRDKTFPAVSETPLTSKIEFASVFDLVKKQTGPRLPGGVEVAIPTFKKGEEYVTPPDRKKRTPGVPKFSPLEILGKQLPTADNRAFCRNAANRLWWVMMGKGLVEPLDSHHSDNPPTHPELLALLADEFAAHDFDVKWLLRELALTRSYQRGSAAETGEPPPPESYRAALQKRLSAEQLLGSLLHATGEQQRLAKEESEPPEEGVSQLDELTGRFRKALANPPRDPEVEFNPSVKGALFLMNDEVVLEWFTPRDGNLVDRLEKNSDDAQVVESIYLSVLSRMPTDDERAAAMAYLAQHNDRRAASVGNLAWALAATTEFAVNH